MMGVNAKQKGNAWERKVANYLSKRFEKITGVEKGFIRASDSGSYFGGRNQSRITTHLEEHQSMGDIRTPDGFIYEIECKAYKTPISFGSLLKQAYKPFDEWIEQARRDSINSGKEPLLIVKFNNVLPFVMIERVRACNASVKIFYKEFDVVEMEDFFERNGDEFFFQNIDSI